MEEDNYAKGSDPSLEAAETFLGGLRSELDEGSHLHATFASLAAVADSVRANYLSYSITPQRAAEIFQKLRLVDDNEIEWTVGPSSGGWYRRRVGTKAWQAGPPPLMAEPRADQQTPWNSTEFADLLPASRIQLQQENKPADARQAAIRVVEATAVAAEADNQDTDFLLSEWDRLETEFVAIQEGAGADRGFSDPVAGINAAWPIQIAFEKLAKQAEPTSSDKSTSPEQRDRPRQVGPVADSAGDMMDLFVRPEGPTTAASARDVPATAVPTSNLGPVEPLPADTQSDSMSLGAQSPGPGGEEPAQPAASHPYQDSQVEQPGSGETSAFTPGSGQAPDSPAEMFTEPSSEGVTATDPDDPYGLGR